MAKLPSQENPSNEAAQLTNSEEHIDEVPSQEDPNNEVDEHPDELCELIYLSLAKGVLNDLTEMALLLLWESERDRGPGLFTTESFINLFDSAVTASDNIVGFKLKFVSHASVESREFCAKIDNLRQRILIEVRDKAAEEKQFFHATFNKQWRKKLRRFFFKLRALMSKRYSQRLFTEIRILEGEGNSFKQTARGAATNLGTICVELQELRQYAQNRYINIPPYA